MWSIVLEFGLPGFDPGIVPMLAWLFLASRAL